MRFKDFILPELDQVLLYSSGDTVELFEGRKWISGRLERNIGIDLPSHGAGQKHAHVLGRKGKEIVVVNVDGSGSHGTKGRLHKDDADALRARGFNIPPSNIVEWNVIEGGPVLLIE